MVTMTRTKRLLVAAAIATTLAACAACASLPLKQKAVAGVQAAHTAVGVAQDAERGIFAAGSVPDLTADRHVAFARFFELYFTNELKVVAALKTWRAGDPVPTDLASAMAALRDALRAADALTDGVDKASLVGRINEAIAKVQLVLDTVGGAR